VVDAVNIELKVLCLNSEQELFTLSEEQKNKLEKLLIKGKRDVPSFCAKGINEELFIPVKDGELRVFHHKPTKITSQRPIVFIPGYIAAPETWVDFHKPHHGFTEYYYIESREKTSSRIKRHRKVQLTVKQSAKDLQQVLEQLDLLGKDYVLMGSSFGGAIILQALIDKLIDPPTIITFDPITKWVYGGFMIKFLNPIVPPFLMGILRNIIAKILLAGMKNKKQKRRMEGFAKGAQPWKFRKASMQNKSFDIQDRLSEIDNEILLFHGPLDRYHPRIAYYNYAKAMPNGRFFFMDTLDENRELLAGVVATEFAKVSSKRKIPSILQNFEIKINRRAKK
jgi:pimeloyl-ACP methyl ester carboxylesterase